MMRVHLGALHVQDGSEPGRKMFEVYAKDMHAHPDFSLITVVK